LITLTDAAINAYGIPNRCRGCDRQARLPGKRTENCPDDQHPAEAVALPLRDCRCGTTSSTPSSVNKVAWRQYLLDSGSLRVVGTFDSSGP
jgi:hypothetical protein